MQLAPDFVLLFVHCAQLRCLAIDRDQSAIEFVLYRKQESTEATGAAEAGNFPTCTDGLRMLESSQRKLGDCSSPAYTRGLFPPNPPNGSWEIVQVRPSAIEVGRLGLNDPPTPVGGIQWHWPLGVGWV
jgi:hypothetical protein